MIEVTLSLSEELYQHAENLAAAAQLDIGSVVSEALAITLPVFDKVIASNVPVLASNGKNFQAGPAAPITPDPQPLLKMDEFLSESLFQQRESEVTTTELTALLSLLLMQRWGGLKQRAGPAEIAGSAP